METISLLWCRGTGPVIAQNILPYCGGRLTPAAVEQRLQGKTEKLRSEEPGKVREAIEQFIARTLVSGDGDLTIKAMPGGDSSGWTETLVR